MDEDAGRWRNDLVDHLAARGYVHSQPVSEAFGTVPRHLFLPGVPVSGAYADDAIVTKWAPDGRPISSSSQPAIMAAMLEQLDVRPGQRVLEIGAGTGYNAALLAHLTGEGGAVTTVDIDAELVEQAGRHLAAAGFEEIKVVCADGAGGCTEGAPYDRIILTASAQDLAPAWLDQLADGGRLVLPLSLRGVQGSVAFERDGDHLISLSWVDCGFMPLRGARAGPDSVRVLGDDPGIFLDLEDDRTVATAALCAALREPGEALLTGITVTLAEVMGGMGLWLALHDADVGRLTALGAAVDRGLVPALLTFPGMATTVVLVGTEALAALVRPVAGLGRTDSFKMAVRAYGSGGDSLAKRLSGLVRGWDVCGRPATASLSIRAYPRAKFSGESGPIVIDKEHTRFVVDW